MEGQDPRQPQKFTRGLYRGVKISVSALNKIIVAGIVLIVVLLIYGISTGGYHVTFDSRGGSDVPYQEYKYGDRLALPENPGREGYTFSGWALDENCTQNAKEGMEVQSDLTLYACWE